jgi:Ser/Thr protein kinase RdoA (MazF antagonist)
MRHRSVYISAAIPRARDENLEYYFRHHFDLAPLPRERVKEKRALLEALAELFRLVHGQDRLYFPDLHPHNLVLAPDEEGRPRLYLVDFDEVRFRVRARDRMKNLASLGRNADKIAGRMARPGLTQLDRLRFLRSYLGERGCLPGALQSLWREVLANWNLK